MMQILDRVGTPTCTRLCTMYVSNGKYVNYCTFSVSARISTCICTYKHMCRLLRTRKLQLVAHAVLFSIYSTKQVVFLSLKNPQIVSYLGEDSDQRPDMGILGRDSQVLWVDILGLGALDMEDTVDHCVDNDSHLLDIHIPRRKQNPGSKQILMQQLTFAELKRRF